ncbi:MAG TPA: site-2 protease family protein [Ktedonobacterales bacterium]|nr:site-2 protease family protein [Ktedonobacterales bacterium]
MYNENDNKYWQDVYSAANKQKFGKQQSGRRRRTVRSGSFRSIARYVRWDIFGAFVILMGFWTFVLWNDNNTKWQKPGLIGFIVTGWVFSLCLHEFAHAATAYLGGDTSDSTISYLSFNPLKYVHPVLSLVMPVIFILLGFIPLPGGAVYLRRDLVRSKGWQSAISAAGPAMNLLVLLALAAPFAVANPLFVYQHNNLTTGIATLAFFQAAAVVLNLIPIPGLDGYGILEPWLPYDIRAALAPFYTYGFLILFLLIWQVPAIDNMYFNGVFHLLTTTGIQGTVDTTIFNFLRPHGL